MSLRWMFRLAGLMLVLAVGLLGASRFQASPLPQAEVGAMYRALAEHAEATRGSVLTVDGAGVVYALPPSATAVRVLSNANLFRVDDARAARRDDAQRRWNYALEVQELDAGGKVLSERVHHFRRDLVEFELPEGQRGTGSFYLEESAPFPLAAANTRLRFDSEARPARLRLRLLSADPDIADVLVRVAVPVPVSQARAESVWRRLNDAQRERLALGNVFPPKLLTEAERTSLIDSRWQPLGAQAPSSERDIYVLRGYELGAPLDRMQAPGLELGPARWATVQLPEHGGDIRIVLEGDAAMEGQSASATRAPAAKVSMRWYGHSAFLRRESSHAWQGSRFEHREKFAGGWLEVRASRAARVRFLLVEGERETDITPPLQHLRAWEANVQAATHGAESDALPLEFSISHAANVPTPLRLVLRRTGGLSSEPVAVTFLDAQGAAVRKFELKPELLASAYDAPWPETAGDPVSEPWEVFFSVPPQVVKLRVVASTPTLVNAYVRPAHLPRTLRVPEDLSTPEAAETAIPGWFAINPDQHEARILAGQSSLLTLRGRPPEDRPELSAGQYQWEDFDPVQGGAARVFLAPREAGVPERREAIGQTYRPLASDQRTAFIAEPGRRQVNARLAWTGAGQQAFRFKVLLNGEPWLDASAEAGTGEVVLPPFEAGQQRLTVVSDMKARWYASHQESGEPWVRRRAWRFDTPLQFEVERTTREAEFIAVRVFRPAGSARPSTRTQLRVRIQAPQQQQAFVPMPGWLFTERAYDVRASGEHELAVAETGGERSDAGQPLYIAIPKGAPAGRYRITLVPEDGQGWIAVSRVTPGVARTARLVLEETGDAS